MDTRLTCIVPTHNRPQFLRRLFRFYEQAVPTFSFLVVDSSRSEQATENRRVIDCVAGSHGPLSVEYQHFDLNFITKCTRALQQLRSPFVVFCADDDLLFPEPVNRSLDFLDASPSHAVALGTVAKMNCLRPDRRCEVGVGYSLEQPRALDRCRWMAHTWFSTFYGIYRTAALRENFEVTAASTDSSRTYFLPEMLLSQLSVLAGPIKYLPGIYSLRETHDANAGYCNRVPDNADQTAELFERFRACLVEQIVRRGESRFAAESFVVRWYGYLREPNVANRRANRPPLERIMRSLRAIGQQVVSPLFSDCVLRRRPLQPRDLIGQEAHWKLATELMSRFPQGLTEEIAHPQRSNAAGIAA